MAHHAKLIDRKDFCKYIEVEQRRPTIRVAVPILWTQFLSSRAPEFPTEAKYTEATFRLIREEEDGLLIYKEM